MPRRPRLRLWHVWAAATILGWMVVGCIALGLYALVRHIVEVAF